MVATTEVNLNEYRLAISTVDEPAVGETPTCTRALDSKSRSPLANAIRIFPTER